MIARVEATTTAAAAALLRRAPALLMLVIIVFAVQALLLLPDGAGAAIAIPPHSSWTSSAENRIFRGTNVVYKGYPWHPDISAGADPKWSFNQDDIDILASHGVTAIRLGVMWPGVEPVRGQYNNTYLDVMKTIVQRCQDAGIYVLLDFHQDGLSEKFCGEGVPLWAAQPDKEGDFIFGFPFPVRRPDKLTSDGIPTTTCSNLFYSDLFYSYASGSAYERLYKNHDGLTDAFVEYWKLVARTFLPFKNILGYDLINEPWAGNTFTDPLLLVPGAADKLNLQPFYDAAAAGIRSVDPNAIIFFESVTWDNILVGFTAVPGGGDYKTTSVLSFHHYEPPVLFGLDKNIEERLQDMDRLGCGGMLTEFEMGWQNGNNVEAIRQKSAISDKYLFSYMGWEYTDYIPITGTNNGLRDPATGNIRPDMAAVYSRTYATAIPGTPTVMSFNDTTSAFVLTFTHDGSRNPLEVRLNTAAHYADGYSVLIGTGADGVAPLQNSDSFRVLSGAGAAANGSGGGFSSSILIIGPADGTSALTKNTVVTVRMVRGSSNSTATPSPTVTAAATSSTPTKSAGTKAVLGPSFLLLFLTSSATTFWTVLSVFL
ncbi:glycoside hydrolase superfamily [Zopfochytrium polystomum]|nr:glycoside hydrolase superfamily [Zopfochytrium polystomum]